MPIRKYKDSRGCIRGAVFGPFFRVQLLHYARMLLAREFIAYLSRQLVSRLSPAAFETTNPATGAAIISQIIEEDLSTEDRLNDEVRDLLEDYSDYMRRENISYQEMFRKIK